MSHLHGDKYRNYFIKGGNYFRPYNLACPRLSLGDTLEHGYCTGKQRNIVRAILGFEPMTICLYDTADLYNFSDADQGWGSGESIQQLTDHGRDLHISVYF